MPDSQAYAGVKRVFSWLAMGSYGYPLWCYHTILSFLLDLGLRGARSFSYAFLHDDQLINSIFLHTKALAGRKRAWPWASHPHSVHFVIQVRVAAKSYLRWAAISHSF